MREEADVLVAGLGPVGAGLAALLAARGLKVIAAEKETEVYRLPRAAHFDAEIMRLFQQIGVAGDVLPFARPISAYEFVNAGGDIIMRFSVPAETAQGWAGGYLFHQPALEEALRGRLAAAPTAEMALGWTLEDFAADAEGVTATLVRDGAARTVRARYLVACDGANSPVRKALGIGLTDYGFDEPWLVVDTLMPDESRLKPYGLQICDPARPVTVMPMSPGRRRWEFMLLPGEDPAAMQEDETVRRLMRPFAAEGEAEIVRKAVYRFHGLVARDWRRGRVFLAGDAAHQTPPFAGQGMCSGLRDAANLAWKLALVLRGDAGDGLLDTYEVERKPHVRAVVASAKEFGIIIGELDPAAAAARDARLRAELKSGKAETIRQRFIPDLVSGLIAEHAKLAGALFVQPRVRTADGAVQRLDDLLKPEFAIVTATPEPMTWLSENLLAEWRQLGGERVVVAASGEPSMDQDVLSVVEIDNLLGEWVQRNAVAAVVVRPDRYVYGAAANAAELNMLVEHLLQNLRAGRQAFQDAALSVPPQ